MTKLTYQTKPTTQNLENQAYQTKPSTPNQITKLNIPNKITKQNFKKKLPILPPFLPTMHC